MNFLKRKNKQQLQKENMEVIVKRIGKSQEAVYKAVAEIDRPVNGLAVARHMHADSASVTPRLAELVKKGRLLVAYQKKGLDGMNRNFYIVNKDWNEQEQG